MKLLRLLIFSILGLLFFSNISEAQSNNAGLVPDYFVAQYAGSIGLVSAGAGYQFGKNRIELDGLVGYLPESVGGVELTTAAIKFNYIPFQFKIGEHLQIKPIRTGVMAAYTFGPEFWGVQPDNYPKGYYTFSTAWHGYYQLGSSINFPAGSDRLGVYYEFNTSIEEIVTWIQNPDFIGPGKIFNLALGAKYYF